MLRGEQGYPNCGFVGQLVGITSWQAGEGDGREEEEGRATMICYPVLPSRKSDQVISKSDFYQTIFLPKIRPKADPNSLFMCQNLTFPKT
jgi:hypothetical protein